MENRKDLEILNTNLEASFWRKLKAILRQNKKVVLLRFLFGTIETKVDIEEKIQILETLVASLQEKVIHLENQRNINMLSAADRIPLKAYSKTEEGKSNKNQTQKQPNFIIFNQISKQERSEIIQTGFRLNQERKISLKKYYESTDPNSLVQSKGYSIKYESIRRTKLYQQLKPSNN